MTERELGRIEAAANQAAAARQALEASIFEAHRAGATLREIAEAAGRSPEWVRRLILGA